MRSLYSRNFAHANGKRDGTLMTNYVPRAAFQIRRASYDNFKPLNWTRAGHYNIEILDWGGLDLDGGGVDNNGDLTVNCCCSSGDDGGGHDDDDDHNHGHHHH